MFNSERFYRDFFRPGVRHIFDGTTGSGKTWSVISLVQHLVQGDIDLGTKVVAITNVVMVKREHGRVTQAYPPGVYAMKSFSEMMRLVGQLLTENGMGNITILMVLDEAQNFMLADQNASKENLAIVKFMANIRKFGICTIFLTPTIKNLAPKIRNFADDPSSPGNLNAYWHKDPRMAEIMVGKNRARSTAIVQLSAEEDPLPIVIDRGTWTTPIDQLREGEYGYDTLSAADFEMGVNDQGVPFDIKKFLNACSGTPSYDIPRAIDEFFTKWDKEGLTEDDVESGALTQKELLLREHVRIARLLVENEGWSVAKTSRLLGYEERQFRRYYMRYCPNCDVGQTVGHSDIENQKCDIYNLECPKGAEEAEPCPGE